MLDRAAIGSVPAAFIGTASSLLANAAPVAHRGLESMAHPTQGIYHPGGLTEATETNACFALM